MHPGFLLDETSQKREADGCVGGIKRGKSLEQEDDQGDHGNQEVGIFQDSGVGQQLVLADSPQVFLE